MSYWDFSRPPAGQDAPEPAGPGDTAYPEGAAFPESAAYPDNTWAPDDPWPADNGWNRGDDKFERVTSSDLKFHRYPPHTAVFDR